MKKKVIITEDNLTYVVNGNRIKMLGIDVIKTESELVFNDRRNKYISYPCEIYIPVSRIKQIQIKEI